jgi:DNA-binding LytR/AlgR family response regulator
MSKITDRADDMLVLLLVNGKRIKFMRHELNGFLKSRQLLISLAAVLGIAIAVDPYVFPEPIHIVGRSIYWFLGIMLYVTVMVLAGQGIHMLSRRLGFGALYWPIVGIPIVIVATVGAAYLGAFFTASVETRLDLEPTAFIRNYLLAQAFEFLLLNYVMGDHLMRQRLRKMRDADTDGQVAALVANGRSIFINHISTLEAKQHYVEITTKSGKFVVRSTLKTLLAQIPEAAGLQVHRSYWVSRNATVQLSGKSGKKMLLLNDGRSVPVSRPRESDVDTWIREQVGLQKT